MGQKQLLGDIHELKGKTLGCFYRPQACHGDILLKLANKQSWYAGCRLGLVSLDNGTLDLHPYGNSRADLRVRFGYYCYRVLRVSSVICG